MTIEVTTQLDPIASKTLSDGIVRYNRASVPDLEPNEAEVKFFVYAKNAKNQVTGGIRATCYWNTLHIELLWLSEECRGEGIGKRLIESAENFAKTHNCEKAFVETTSWQAKPFYEKNGYVLLASFNGRPKGHSTHYLTKDL